MDFNFENDIILKNEFVCLSPIAANDFDSLSKIALAEKNLVQFSPSQIHTPEHLKNYIQTAIDERKNKIRYAFVVLDKKQNLIAGSTSFGSILNTNKCIEIGWTWIGKQFQQTGLNRQMKFLMMQYVFEKLEFERLGFRTDERNMQSRNAIAKIGGIQEGILRSDIVMSDGFRRNTVYFGILRGEWEGIKGRIFKEY